MDVLETFGTVQWEVVLDEDEASSRNAHETLDGTLKQCDNTTIMYPALSRGLIICSIKQMIDRKN